LGGSRTHALRNVSRMFVATSVAFRRFPVSRIARARVVGTPESKTTFTELITFLSMRYDHLACETGQESRSRKWEGRALRDQEKPRARRKPVKLPARMRGEASWADVTLRNVSIKGLMAETDQPPDRGAYVEIRRGGAILVGVVVWSKGSRFGVSLSEQVDLNALEDRRPLRPGAERRVAGNRSAPGRTLVITTPSDWRWLGKAIERFSLIFAGALAVSVLALLVFDVLSKAMRGVTRGFY